MRCWARGWITVVLIGMACGGASMAADAPRTGRVLHLYNWDNYIDPSLLKAFEREHGVRVVEDKFASNEELLAKLQAGAGGYDVAVPSDYMVRIMTGRGMLAPLDHTRLPHLRNLAPRFREAAYDPGLKYSVPYLWGLTGFGYARKPTGAMGPPQSWDDIFNPAKAKRFRGRVSMLNDMRELIGAALIYRGYSPNSVDPRELQEARDVLLAQKPHLAKYDSESYKESLASGEIWVAHGWSGEIHGARRQNADIGFAVPREGTFLFVDNLIIPKNARNRADAEQFINFLLRADVAAQNATFLRYPTPNEAAQRRIDPGLEGPNLKLPVGVKLYSLEDLGENARMYEKIWTELKAR